MPERASTPLVEAAFQFIDTESENKAKFRKPRLHLVATGAFKEQLGVSIFQFYESEIRFVPAYPLDKSPMTFPGWLRLPGTARHGPNRQHMQTLTLFEITMQLGHF